MAEQLLYRKLKTAEELSDFYCGVKEMDEVLHGDLDWMLEEYHCDSYVIQDTSGNIVAFFALEYDKEFVLDDDYKDDLLNGLSAAETPKFNSEKEKDDFEICNKFYAVDISYLAVGKNMQKRGIGSAILRIISDIALRERPESIFITVDAIQIPGYSAVGFYRKNKFQELLPPQVNVLRMFKTNY